MKDRKLRKIEKNVNKYFDLVWNKPFEVKNNIDFYIEDVELLKAFIDIQINQSYKLLLDWCNALTQVFNTNNNTIFSKILMAIIYKFLTKYIDELYFEGILKERLENISQRLLHFKYLLNNKNRNSD